MSVGSAGESVAASFMKMVQELGRDTTLVIVEHDMDIVFEIADYITVLHHGEVIAEGTAEQIKANRTVMNIYLGEDN